MAVISAIFNYSINYFHGNFFYKILHLYIDIIQSIGYNVTKERE
nr:MAG TPA: hypothetical protein [Caudoviricetes sp.]